MTPGSCHPAAKSIRRMMTPGSRHTTAKSTQRLLLTRRVNFLVRLKMTCGNIFLCLFIPYVVIVVVAAIAVVFFISFCSTFLYQVLLTQSPETCSDLSKHFNGPWGLFSMHRYIFLLCNFNIIHIKNALLKWSEHRTRLSFLHCGPMRREYFVQISCQVGVDLLPSGWTAPNIKDEKQWNLSNILCVLNQIGRPPYWRIFKNKI